MGWSPSSAANAYLDTLKLCKHDQERGQESCKSVEPKSTELISALAAGMNAKLIVEVSSGVSDATIALAAAARQTGGKLVCILPDSKTLDESKAAVKDSGLKDNVEFKVGDPFDLLPSYEHIDFSLVDCKMDGYSALLKLLDVNPRMSVVVASNLAGGRKGLAGGHVRGAQCVSTKSIGKGMEVTMMGKFEEFEKRERLGSWKERKGVEGRRFSKSRWVTRVDEESGEEHIFRVPRSL